MRSAYLNLLLAIMATLQAGCSFAISSPSSSSESERFIIFAREEGSGGWDGMTSAVWEFNPSKPEQPFVRKHVFAKSHWSPALCFPDAAPALEEWVRVQINDVRRPNGFFVRLYKVDYTDWSTSLILESDQIVPLGFSTDTAYVSTSEGKKRIDLKTAKVTPMEPQFTKLWDFGRIWIIQPDASLKNVAQVFDVSLGKPTSSFSLPEWYQEALRVKLSPDSGILAICGDVDRSKMISGFGLPAKSLPAKIALIDIRTNLTTIHNVTIYSCPGSGVPNLCPSFDAWFPDKEHFNYISAVRPNQVIDKPISTEEAKSLLELVTVDLTTRLSSRQPFSGKYPESKADQNIWIPEYLAQQRAEIISYEDLAHAFLKYMGLNYVVPSAWDQTKVGFSADRKRFLLKMVSSTESDFFLYGNLETKDYKRVAAPEALRKINDMSIVVVTKH